MVISYRDDDDDSAALASARNFYSSFKDDCSIAASSDSNFDCSLSCEDDQDTEDSDDDESPGLCDDIDSDCPDLYGNTDSYDDESNEEDQSAEASDDDDNSAGLCDNNDDSDEVADSAQTRSKKPTLHQKDGCSHIGRQTSAEGSVEYRNV